MNICNSLRRLFSPAPAMVEKRVLCAALDGSGLHRMAYTQWGDPANPRVLVCVHGLTRNGRDFDFLARQLSRHYRVVCPDVVGRGRSDWLKKASGYGFPQYVADMVSLIARLDVAEVHWLGTSMGGLIGMAFSSVPAEVSGVRLRRFVMNDVGPRLRHEAIVRIGDYLGRPMRFDSEQQAADYLWGISTGFGPHTPEQWLGLSRPLLRPAPEGGGLVLHYDPAIAEPFKGITPEATAAGEAALWQAYDAISGEVLLLRGADSDLLDRDTALEMSRRGPKARLVEFAGVGHAPTLMAADQVEAIAGFLLA